jgi:hypothetical protein
MTAKNNHETRLRLANSQRTALRFILEPWGREYMLRPNDEFVLVFRGPGTSEPEVVLGKGTIEVWGWTGTTVQVFKNGQELTEYIPEELPRPLLTSSLE